MPPVIIPGNYYCMILIIAFKSIPTNSPYNSRYKVHYITAARQSHSPPDPSSISSSTSAYCC